ncbi:hypothetical protein JW998_10410 [candidate division KSB1 bacterium]|nr:hypothetical protein [candidate division KSB1 bacterium]
MRTSLLIDAHVHIYPNFDLDRAIRSGLENFHSAETNGDTVKVWLLTERSDCHFFRDALTFKLDNYHFVETGDDPVLRVKSNAHDPLLYIVAGRQLISSDDLEICALATRFQSDDRALDTVDLIHAVLDAGGVAAINWAPGKWFGARGRVVRQLFENFSPQELFISDTTMRPTVWRTPKLMAAAMRQGFRVLCGSDPLPFEGEEDLIASYTFGLAGEFDHDQPAQSLKSLLRHPSTTFTVHGHRSGPFTFLQRQTRIMSEKRK